MSAEPIVHYVGSRNPSLSDRITVDGAAFDLSSSTVAFSMRPIGSSTPRVNAAAAVVVNAANGDVRYDWQAADVVAPGGLFLAWWDVTTSGKTQTKGEFLLELREHALGTGSLVELAEVRLAMGLPDSDRSLDARILEAIASASGMIGDEVQRDLFPIASATRRRSSRTHVVDLAPFDLRTVSSVTLDPDGAATVLAAGDYMLAPAGGSDVLGTYTELLLDPALALDSLDGVQKFGEVVVEVAGAWGPAAIPRIAREACITTVRSWLRRDVASYAGYEDGEGGATVAPIGTYGLPPAARNQLRPLYRFRGGVA